MCTHCIELLTAKCFCSGPPAAQVEKELAGIMGRLNNPKFVEKASADYIAEVRGQAADAQNRLSSIEQKIKQVQQVEAA